MSRSVSFVVDVDTARYTAFSVCAASLLVQTIIYIALEIWRRKRRQVRDSFYNTHPFLITLHIILQMGIGAYYGYRGYIGIDEHGTQFVIYLYAQMTVYAAIATGLCTMTLIFASIRSIGMNLASFAHFCSLAALALWLEDPFAVLASCFAIILSTITSPGTYKLKTQ